MLANGRIPTIATPPPKHERVASRWAGKVRGVLAGAKVAILWAVFVACAITTAAAAGWIVWAHDVNAKFDALMAGDDIAVDAASAPPELLAARAYFLLTRDNLQDAQPLLDQAAVRAGDRVQVRMLYNMANARVRTAVAEIQNGRFDQAVPQVALAKAEYRSALRLDPGNWDVKYNLDVAMRLVRDLPRQEGEVDEEGVKEPAKLWTDLPGVPKGLP